MTDYPKAFERYYQMSHGLGVQLEPWVYARVKQLAFNAWKAGRKHERELRDAK